MAVQRNWNKIISLLGVIAVLSSVIWFIPDEHPQWLDWAAMLGFVIVGVLSIWSVLLVGGFGRNSGVGVDEKK